MFELKDDYRIDEREVNVMPAQIAEQIEANVRQLLKKEPHILAVYLLGSTLRGTMRPDSDIDLGLMIEPGYKISALERAYLSGIISYKMRRTVDIGEISSNNLVYAREALLKGKIIYTKNKDSVNLYRANLLAMYLQYNKDRQEVVNAYRAG